MYFGVKAAQFKGLKEVNDFLAALPEEVAHKAMNQGIRRAANKVALAAQARAPVYSGPRRVIRTKGKGKKTKGKTFERIIVRGLLKKAITTRKVPGSKADYYVGVFSRTFAVKNPPPEGASRVRLSAFYAHMVEYGTSKMSARPFLRPAVDSMRGEMPKIIAEEVNKAIERLAKKHKA